MQCDFFVVVVLHTKGTETHDPFERLQWIQATSFSNTLFSPDFTQY